jgi:hypothetical protein
MAPCAPSLTPLLLRRGQRLDTLTTTVITQIDYVKVKMLLLNTYDSSRTKLKAFLIQAKLYIGFNRPMFANKL